MESEFCSPAGDPRLVGDPVDTLTGAVIDRMLDFRLTGPIELRWWRHYDSSLNQTAFALGWGHTHQYDCALRADDRSLTLEEPIGRSLGFPRLAADGERITRHGCTLLRVALRRYVVMRHGGPAMEFEFQAPHARARLARLYRGRHEVRFEYDAQLRLTRIRDAAGRAIAVREDGTGRLLRLDLEAGGPAPAGLLMAYAYDTRGNLVRTENAAGHGHVFEYDDANRLVLRQGRKGFRFRFRYDSLGRCTLASGDDRLYAVAMDYKLPGRLTRVQRPDGGVWGYEFTPGGVLAQIHDPLGGVQRFIRDTEGRLVMELDPNGNAFRQVHDETGAPVATLDPLGHRHDLPEDPNAPDPMRRRVASRGVEYEFGRLFDTAGTDLPTAAQARAMDLPAEAAALLVLRETAATPPGPQAQPFDVKPLGACWWPAPAQGRVFSPLGKLAEQHDGLGRRRRWTYDASGNLAEYVDFDGARWQYDHGRWHFLMRRVSPVGAALGYGYTPSGEVATFEDAGGCRSEYRYDLKDHLVEVWRHGALRETYVRDAVGNLVGKRAADGRELLRIEVGHGNLPVRRWLACGDEHRLQYDAAGRLASATTRTDEFTMAHDAIGNQTMDKRNGLGVELRFAAWGRPIRQVWFDRFAVRHERRTDGTVLLTDPGGQRHGLRVRRHGVVQRQHSNGSTEVAQYDAAGRCQFKQARRGGAAAQKVWTRRHHWSGEGELRAVSDSLAGETRHEYDAAHRLRRRYTGGRVEEFRLDLADNLLAQPGLESVDLVPGNRLARANGEDFSHDDRHHVASRRAGDRVVRYHYDSRDQLAAIDLPGGPWRAEYDVLGRRVRKHWQGQVTEYYWNGDQLAAEVGPRGGVRLYVYADPLALSPLMLLDYASIQAPAAECTRYYVFSDHLGTPNLIENDAHEVVWQARIAPFGAAAVQDGSRIECHLRWPGHYFDAETGLHYNRFRYYDPVLGRYLQSDPWGIAGGANLYAYFSNPLAAVDVRGLGDESDKPAKAKDDEEGTRPPTPKGEGHDHDAPTAFPNLQRGGGNTNAHADRAVTALRNTKPPIKQNRSVTVIEHADGTVSVGISGGDPKRAADAQKVVDNLNATHPSDPPTYRTTSGPVDASGLNDPGSKANPAPMPGTCSEPQAAQAAGTSGSAPESYQTVWSGPKDCPPDHQLPDRPVTPGGNEQMQPCPTCQSNADNYTQISTGNGPLPGQ
jgi:RHS repeat-associated protein